jgi:hypothetical protein
MKSKAPKRVNRVVWFTFKDGAFGEWSVLLVRKVDKKDRRGVTDADKRQILIKFSSDYTLLCRTFVHEMLHVAGKETVRDEDDDDPQNNMNFYAEELFIQGAEDRLHAILLSLGFKFPDIPDAAAALA